MHNFKFRNPGDLKHQVCPRINRPSVYAPDNKLILSPEHQTPLFLLFRQQIIQPPQSTFPCTQAPHQVQTFNSTTPNPLILTSFRFRTQSLHLTSLLPSHKPLWIISLSSKHSRIIITQYTKLYVPLLLLSQICPISLSAKILCQI